MNKVEVEKEIAYEWIKNPVIVEKLDSLKLWSKQNNIYELVDSIYDTQDDQLSELSTGVRIRTQDNKTLLTAKRFIRKNKTGENIFKEYHSELNDNLHPNFISTSELNLRLPILKIYKQFEFTNNRQEYIFTNKTSTIKIINEVVTYINLKRVFKENLLEIEFYNVPNNTLRKVVKELESKYAIKQINEGKTDRAKRFLKNLEGHPLIENKRNVAVKNMSAHGGVGITKIKFFHQPYNHYNSPESGPKTLNHKSAGWDFFGLVILPVGSEIKKHLHTKSDEIYYILKGSATIIIDGRSQIIHPGDCILTQKGSNHAVINVTRDLEFIATEILNRGI